jgi:hypothetical protein
MVELVCATTVMTVVMAAAALVATSGTETAEASNVRADLERRARRTVDLVARALVHASADSLAAFAASPSWDDVLTVDRPEAVDPADGSVTWSAWRFALELAPGETLNGADDNRNGLVDDGVVVLTRDWGTPGATRTVVCTGVRRYLEGETGNGADDNGNGLVDERGLCFERVGSTVTVRLTLEKRDGKGQLVTATARATVTLRN